MDSTALQEFLRKAAYGPELLVRALRSPDNNLILWRDNDLLVRWIKSDSQATEALRSLWDTAQPLDGRLRHAEAVFQDSRADSDLSPGARERIPRQTVLVTVTRLPNLVLTFFAGPRSFEDRPIR